MSTKLDQLVKGAPPPEADFNIPSTSPIIPPDAITSSTLADPLASLPSSPPQIYLNLLILEASLRAQWLQLRTRRRQHTFFLTLLCIWLLYFGYALFFAPREDGSGVGGSVYWAVELAEKVCFMGGVILSILIWATGQWDRGVRWPRRWVRLTNSGLRGFNCKLVVIKQAWWRDFLSALSFLFSYGLFSSTSQSSYRYVDQAILKESEKGSGPQSNLPNIDEDDAAGYEEDLAPGGDYIKLLLLPKPFSPNFRENWDVFRMDYWEKENERRGVLRQRLKVRERKIAKEEGGWLWWTGYRGWKRGKPLDLEKTHHTVRRHGSVEKDLRRIRAGSVRSGSHSRNSSRSGTPNFDLQDGSTSGHVRRGSTASNSSDRRKKKATSTTRGQNRSASPEVHSPLVRDNSYTSVSSLDSERSALPAGTDGESAKSLRSASRPSSISPTRRPGSLRIAKQA